jgi:hypothetical protein
MGYLVDGSKHELHLTIECNGDEKDSNSVKGVSITKPTSQNP